MRASPRLRAGRAQAPRLRACSEAEVGGAWAGGGGRLAPPAPTAPRFPSAARPAGFPFRARRRRPPVLVSVAGAESALAAPVRRAWQLGGAGPPCGSAPQVEAAGAVRVGAGTVSRWGEACAAAEILSRPGSRVPGPDTRHRAGAVGPLTRRGSAGDARLPTGRSGRRGGRGFAERELLRGRRGRSSPARAHTCSALGSEPGQLRGILARAGASWPGPGAVRCGLGTGWSCSVSAPRRRPPHDGSTRTV